MVVIAIEMIDINLLYVHPFQEVVLNYVPSPESGSYIREYDIIRR